MLGMGRSSRGIASDGEVSGAGVSGSSSRNSIASLLSYNDIDFLQNLAAATVGVKLATATAGSNAPGAQPKLPSAL